MKEKLAYLVSLHFGANTNVVNPQVVQNQVRTLINTSLNSLETDFLNNETPSENFLIRHAAVANLPLQLTTKQQGELVSLCETIRKHAEDVGDTMIVSKMHPHQETDAQRLAKLEESIRMLALHGHAITETIQSSYESFTNGLGEAGKKLDTLDSAYKGLSLAINTMQEATRHGYETFWTGNAPTVPTKVSQEKIECAL